MIRPSRSGQAGVTLVEVLLACAILCFMSLTLFEGLIVAARIARENRILLELDMYAFDRLWLALNKNFPKDSSIEEEGNPIPANYVPAFYDYDKGKYKLREEWDVPKVSFTTRLNTDKTEAMNTIRLTYGRVNGEPKELTRSLVRGNVPRAAKGK